MPSDSSAVMELELLHGRTLKVSPQGDDQLVEIRAASGLLELRVRMTEEGAILQMESVRISLKAAESVDIECKDFKVNAEQSVEMQSKGDFQIRGEADVRVDANGDVRVQGKMIYLN